MEREESGRREGKQPNEKEEDIMGKKRRNDKYGDTHGEEEIEKKRGWISEAIEDNENL